MAKSPLLNHYGKFDTQRKSVLNEIAKFSNNSLYRILITFGFFIFYFKVIFETLTVNDKEIKFPPFQL